MIIQNTKTIHQGPVKMLIFGQSGSGKTSLVKTLPKDMKALVISAEQGLLSLSGSEIDYVDLSIGDDGKPLMAAQRYAKLGEIYKYLMTEEAKSKYQLVFIDSITEIAEFILDTTKEKFPDRKDSFLLWGSYATTMINIIKTFRDLPHYHVIFTSLEELDKDESGKRFYGPDIPGSAAKAFLTPAMDQVLRLCFLEGKRIIMTVGTESVRAKDRSGRLNPIEESSLGTILSKINGTYVKPEVKKDEKST